MNQDIETSRDLALARSLPEGGSVSQFYGVMIREAPVSFCRLRTMCIEWSEVVYPFQMVYCVYFIARHA